MFAHLAEEPHDKCLSRCLRDCMNVTNDDPSDKLGIHLLREEVDNQDPGGHDEASSLEIQTLALCE